MKYKSEKTLRRAKKAFSLVELMIVIVIIGALTAIILPQFDSAEETAKDAGCDASNYGTLRQLANFYGVHGVYPSRLHTGLQASSNGVSSSEVMATMPSFTAVNMLDGDNDTGKGGVTYVTLEPDSDYTQSLRNAGIVTLMYGGFPASVDDASSTYTAFIGVGATTNRTAGYYKGSEYIAADLSALNSELGLSGGDALDADGATAAGYTYYAEGASGGDVYVAAISGDWYEEWEIGTNGIVDTDTLKTDTTPISINGIPLPYYMFADPYSTYYGADDIADIPTVGPDGTLSDGDGIIVPLFITPATQWDKYYDTTGVESGTSMVQVAQAGACPWLEAGADFRYYIGIFKLYADGSKAKLLGTMCPEGGSINP